MAVIQDGLGHVPEIAVHLLKDKVVNGPTYELAREGILAFEPDGGDTQPGLFHLVRLHLTLGPGASHHIIGIPAGLATGFRKGEGGAVPYLAASGRNQEKPVACGGHYSGGG